MNDLLIKSYERSIEMIAPIDEQSDALVRSLPLNGICTMVDSDTSRVHIYSEWIPTETLDKDARTIGHAFGALGVYVTIITSDQQVETLNSPLQTETIAVQKKPARLAGLIRRLAF